MATLYSSYKLEDRPIAHELATSLAALNHEVIYDAVAPNAGIDWRVTLAEELRRSDAMVVILNERSLVSTFVTGEMGAARALYREFGRPIFRSSGSTRRQ